MKRQILIILILISNIYIYSQPFRLGIKANILTGNKYLNYEIGPALILDYSVKDIPISISGSTRFYLSELSNENNFSTGSTLTVFSVGVSINYYPIVWSIEPYIGAGIFYNSNNLTESGTPSPNSEGIIRRPSYLKNNFAAEITGGISSNVNSPIIFVVEVTQTFNKPEYNLNTTNTNGIINTTSIQKEKFNFNSLFLNLGLYFKI